MNAADEQIRLYPIAQLAALWGVSKEYVYNEIREGRLAVVELGNGDRDKARVSSVDAANWISARRRAPGVAAQRVAS